MKALLALTLFAFLIPVSAQQSRPTDEQLDQIEMRADLTKCQVSAERLLRRVEQLQKELEKRGCKIDSKTNAVECSQ